MKKTTLFLIAITLFSFESCTTINAYQNASFVDFSRYDKFYMSQSPTADFKFIPLGIVSSITLAGDSKFVKEPAKDQNTGDIKKSSWYNLPEEATTNKTPIPSSQDAIDLLFKKALEKGADGILNLKIEYVSSTTVSGSGYSASGMAIKR